MKKNKKSDNILLILEVILVVFLFIISISSLLSSRNENGLKKDPIFGYSFLAVRSESMDPYIKKGDVIIVQAVKEGYEFKAGAEDGDVITFIDENDDGTLFANTHRIVRIDENGVIWTQGDNHEVSQVEKSTAKSEILAIYKHVRIPVIGSAVTFLIDSKTNYTIFVLLPLLILFIWNLFSFMKSFADYKRKKQVQAAVESGEISDELKELAIKEYLAKQKEMALQNENKIANNEDATKSEEKPNEVENNK